MNLRVADVVEFMAERYPPSLAEPWDRVGLVAGDPEAPVAKIALAVDPVRAVVDEALDWGADLLICHHPLLLRAVNSVAADTFKGAIVHRLIRGGCALLTAHTNADAAPDGVADALARAIGVIDLRPLVPAPDSAWDSAAALSMSERSAMAAAGAGGRPTDSSAGEGGSPTASTPSEGGTPTASMPGEGGTPTGSTPGEGGVAADVPGGNGSPRGSETSLRGMSGIGRVGRLARPMALLDFARQVADAIPATAQGVRVAGDLDARVSRIAVVGGAGDSLFDEVRRSGADVYVTADLRHHPASEARERAEFDGAGRPYLVDVSHAASEWPWLETLASLLRGAAAERGVSLETRVSTLPTDPWVARLDGRH